MALRSFTAVPSVCETDWTDPGPRLSPPIEVSIPEPAQPPKECPPARECCSEFSDALDGGLLGVQCCVPFEPRKVIPPTAFIFSEGGHHGWAAIRYCPFCGVPVTFEEVSRGAC